MTIASNCKGSPSTVIWILLPTNQIERFDIGIGDEIRDSNGNIVRHNDEVGQGLDLSVERQRGGFK